LLQRSFTQRWHSAADEQFAEKLRPGTSDAKAHPEKKGFLAAPKPLRHAKASFSALCEVGTDFAAVAAPPKRCPDTNREFFSKLCDDDFSPIIH
jgi:hypothetical protein